MIYNNVDQCHQALNAYFDAPTSNNLSNVQELAQSAGNAVMEEIAEQINNAHAETVQGWKTKSPIQSRIKNFPDTVRQTIRRVKAAFISCFPVRKTASAGLPNLVNTCFANAVLQAFLLSGGPIEKRLLAKLADPEAKKLQSQLRKLKNQWEKGADVEKILKQIFSSSLISQQLQVMNNQEDAHEFLTILLDALGANQDKSLSLNMHDDFTTKGSWFPWRSATHKYSSTSQQAAFLQLKGLGNSEATVEQLVKRTLEEENIQHTEYGKKRIFLRAPRSPRSFILQLPRFTDKGKNTTPVKGMNDEIRLPFCNRSGQVQKFGVYRVKAVVHHLGSSLHAGHYTASVAKTGDRWERRDDSIVNQEEGKQALLGEAEKTAYLLRLEWIRDEKAAPALKTDARKG